MGDRELNMKNTFYTLFENFLRSRHLLRHFARWQLSLGAKPQQLGSAQLPKNIEEALLHASRADAEELLIELSVGNEGLDESRAQTLRNTLGANEVCHEKPLLAWQHLWQCFRNPFNLLLSALALISWLTDDMKATVVISTMVVVSTLLRFVQEDAWWSRRIASGSDWMDEWIGKPARR